MIDIYVLVLLLVSIMLIVYLIDYLVVLNKLKKESTDNIIIKNNTIDFDSLTLRQKIAHMILIYGNRNKNPILTNINIGGVFIDRQKTKEDYTSVIDNYQENSKIKLFVATDMEGVWNPFSSFKAFPKFSDIENKEEAYKAGFGEGKLMKELGFNLNFAPVAEFEDKVYGGRAFSGSKEEVKEKLEAYISGLQKNVLGTCKHYPGRGMIKNLHIRRDRQEINKDDLELFDICFRNNISSVMIGHQIVYGKIDSKGKPSSVSKEVVDSLNKSKFKGLVISDEVNMLGLKRFHWFNKREKYADLINSGENVILEFMLTPKEIYKLISKLEKDVKNGKIDESKINESVKRILIAKGYKLK